MKYLLFLFSLILISTWIPSVVLLIYDNARLDPFDILDFPREVQRTFMFDGIKTDIFYSSRLTRKGSSTKIDVRRNDQRKHFRIYGRNTCKAIIREEKGQLFVFSWDSNIPSTVIDLVSLESRLLDEKQVPKGIWLSVKLTVLHGPWFPGVNVFLISIILVLFIRRNKKGEMPKGSGRGANRKGSNLNGA
jgi:hypothetical protein